MSQRILHEKTFSLKLEKTFSLKQDFWILLVKIMLCGKIHCHILKIENLFIQDCSP